MVDDAVKRVFALSRQDIYFIIIISNVGSCKWALTLVSSNQCETFRKAYTTNNKIEILPLLEDLQDVHNSSGQIIDRQTR